MKLTISAREFMKQKIQVGLYVVSLVLSLGVFLALDSVQVAVTEYIDQEKRNLVGADVVVESNRAFEPELQTALDEAAKQYTNVDVYEFSSMASTAENAVLSQIKVVSPEHPLYGVVELQSGQDFRTQLTSGQVVAEQGLLDRLDIQVGADITLGDTTVKVVDVIVSEPDRSLNLFQLGPRILVSTVDLEELNLVGDKSRVEYMKLFRIPDENEQKLLRDKLSQLIERPAEVETLAEADTSLSMFSDRFLLFLKLVIFSLLILTAIGIITLLKSFLQSQRNIIAIRKSLGETNRDILLSYLTVFCGWSAGAFLLAIAAATGILTVTESLLMPILPETIALELQWLSIAETFLLGFGTSVLAATFVLVESLAYKPASLFRIEENLRKIQPISWLLLLLGVALYTVFLFIELENWLWTAVFLGAIFAAFLLFWFLSWAVLRGLQKIRGFFSHSFRLTVRSLSRPGSSTSLFLSIFTLSLTVLFSLLVLENTIQKQFVLSYPENVPNVFLLDIRRDQVADIETTFANEVEFFPVIRGPITRINDQTIEEFREGREAGRDITRAFSLTYYDQKREDEEIVRSVVPDEIFSADFSEAGVIPVSVMDEIANSLEIDLGDVLTFNIQGVPITATVTSIRNRLESGPSPFFYFVFPPEFLQEAPQTLFATARIAEADILVKQQQIAQKFPQVSFIDTSQIGVQVGEILRQLSEITQFFGLFNLLIGFIIFLVSLVATSDDRKQEAVFYRLQGMTLPRVWKILGYEFTFIGLFAIGIALVTSAGSAQWILSSLFDLTLSSLPTMLYGYAGGLLLSIFGVGFLILQKPLATKPIRFLRESARE